MADDDLKAVAKRLKEAGAKDLTKELNKGITNAVTPLKKSIPKSARLILPGRGGLAERVATSKISISKRNGGVRLTMKNQYQLVKMDNPGLLRRPVFPRRTIGQKITFRKRGRAKLHKNRKKWAWESQKIRAGFFSEPTARAGKQAAKEIENAMTDVVRKLEGR